MPKILIYQFWDVLHFFFISNSGLPSFGTCSIFIFFVGHFDLVATRDERKKERETQRDARVMSHKRTIDHQLFLATDAANCQKKKRWKKLIAHWLVSPRAQNKRKKTKRYKQTGGGAGTRTRVWRVPRSGFALHALTTSYQWRLMLSSWSAVWGGGWVGFEWIGVVDDRGNSGRKVWHNSGVNVTIRKLRRVIAFDISIHRLVVAASSKVATV